MCNQLKLWSDEELDSDWGLLHFCETVIVISLPHAEDRRASIRQELHKIGIDQFEIFTAINGKTEVDPKLIQKMQRNWAKIDTSTKHGREKLLRQHQGETGCYLSHYYALLSVYHRFQQAHRDMQAATTPEERSDAQARMRKYSRVLILEDDNGFGFVSLDRSQATLAGSGRHLRNALLDLPKHWDLFYLMVGSHSKVRRTAPFIRGLKGQTICANAYIVNHTFYEDLLNHLARIFDPTVQLVYPVDNEIASLHKNHSAYAIYPSLAYQQGGQSSIISSNRTYLRQLHARE